MWKGPESDHCSILSNQVLFPLPASIFPAFFSSAIWDVFHREMLGMKTWDFLHAKQKFLALFLLWPILTLVMLVAALCSTDLLRIMPHNSIFKGSSSNFAWCCWQMNVWSCHMRNGTIGPLTVGFHGFRLSHHILSENLHGRGLGLKTFCILNGLQLPSIQKV